MFFCVCFLSKFWRQTTWGGWVVRQIQTTGRHFKPFVAKVSVMMQDEGNLGKRLLMFFLRLLIIAVGVLFVLAMGRVFTFLVGGDIIKEEEVVVVHEYDTIEEAMKARAATGRGKKSRQHTKDE